MKGYELLACFIGLMAMIPPEDPTPDATAGQVARLKMILRPQTYHALTKSRQSVGSWYQWRLSSLADCSAKDLLRIPGIGPKRLAEIRRVLAENGLTLKGD